jgi:hypothetical protein
MGPGGHLQLSTAHRISTRSLPERATLTALVAGLGAAVLFSPVKLCVMAFVFSVPCPGCGMTRATLALLRGDFGRALAIHPLALVIVPLAIGALVTGATAYVRTGAAFGAGRAPRALELVGAALVILLLGVWLARFAGYFGGPVSVG